MLPVYSSMMEAIQTLPISNGKRKSSCEWNPKWNLTGRVSFNALLPVSTNLIPSLEKRLASMGPILMPSTKHLNSIKNGLNSTAGALWQRLSSRPANVTFWLPELAYFKCVLLVWPVSCFRPYCLVALVSIFATEFGLMTEVKDRSGGQWTKSFPDTLAENNIEIL